MTRKINKKNFDLWYNKALDYMEAGDYEKTIRALNFALVLDRDHAYAWVAKAGAYFMQKKFADAGRAMDHAIRLGADDFNVWFIKGYSSVETKDYQAAVDALDNAVFLNPKDPEAWYYRAFALSCLQRNREALKSYDQAIRHDPKNIDLLCYKGFTLCDLGRYDEATELFAKCLRKDPGHLLALINISERHIVAGQIDQGIREARKTLKLSMDTEFMLLSRWLIIAAYYLKGEREKAGKELEKMMRHIRSLKRLPKITDWSFECMADLIREKLDDPSQKILLDLIDLLTGAGKQTKLPRSKQNP